MSFCEHHFEYQGLVHSESEYLLPGSGARSRFYEDAYFCTKCVEVVYKNKREIGNTYMKPLTGSLPK